MNYLGGSDAELRTRQLASVPRDATSGKLYPASAFHWQTLGYGASNNIYLCQDSSGDLADAMGNQNLTVAGSPLYGQSVTGHSRLAVVTSETSGQGFYVSDALNTAHPSLGSTAWFGVVKINSTTSNRILLTLSGLNLYVQINNIGTLRLVVQGATNVDGSYNYKDGAAHPFIVRWNWATQTVKIITDKEIISSTFRTAALTTGTHGINTATTVPPNASWLYLADFYGDAAEMMGADTLVSLGWSLAYSASTDAGTSQNTTLPDVNGTGRTVKLLLPSSYQYNRGSSIPLVLCLHQYGGTSTVMLTGMNILGLQNLGSGYAVIRPEGKVDSASKQFWNANAAGCDLDHTAPADAAYLRGLLVAALANVPNIDPKRVYVTGQSNGAAMTLELIQSCDDMISGAFVAAGFIPTAETPAMSHGKPVNLVIHAAQNESTVLYAGNNTTTPNPFTGFYKGQLAMVDAFAAANAAAGGTTAGSLQTAYDTIDLNTDQVGSETSRQAYSGMPTNGAVEHWSNTNTQHIPAWTNFFTYVLGWLDAHPRP